jgi:hypothetical protein
VSRRASFSAHTARVLTAEHTGRHNRQHVGIGDIRDPKVTKEVKRAPRDPKVTKEVKRAKSSM